MRETDNFFIIDAEIIVSMEKFSQLIWDISKKNLIWLFQYHLFRYLGHLLQKWDFPLYFWWNVNCLSNSIPMKTEGSNVEDINIHQIIERLSMSCVASSGERSNIFRNRTLTLCKRMIVILEKCDSVAVYLFAAHVTKLRSSFRHSDFVSPGLTSTFGFSHAVLWYQIHPSALILL